MARDNDELVHSISSSSLPSPQPSESAEDRPDSPSEEDVAAFDRVFAQFDPNNLGVVSMRDFLAIIDELDALRPKSAKPLLTEVQREQSLAFTSSEGGTAEMTRDQLFQFIKEMTGNKIIVASPKKKIITKREDAPSPTKSEVQRRGLLPGISAKSQVRAPHNKRRGDLERMADGTTNIIAEDNENFSAVFNSFHAHGLIVRSLLHLIFHKKFLHLISRGETRLRQSSHPLRCHSLEDNLRQPEKHMKDTDPVQ